MLSRRLLLTTALVAASAALPGTVRADEPIKVVATFSILGDMVDVIGGDAIDLTTLVGPDGDAHVYQPTPQAAKAVSEADVLILNGLEFEGWLERLTEAAAFDGQLVVATDGVEALDFDDHHDEHDDHDDHGDHAEEHGEHKDDDHDHDHAEHKHDDDHDHDHAEHKHDDDHAHDHDEHKHDDHAGHDDHDHEKHAGHDDHDHDEHAGHDDHDDHDDHGDDHAGHNHGAFDPHAWQSIENALIYVDNIAAGLAKADPDNASVYFTNRAGYVEELEAVGAEITSLMAALPDEKRTVVTSHDAFGYFADAYNLEFEAPQGLSTESEASAADVAELITQIRDDGIAAVFVESITDNRLMEQIVNETGATIGGTLYSDALSDTDGPASTYLDMMRHNAATISQALGS